MNIVMITAGMRPDLLVQSLESAANNAADWSQHHLTLVVDGHEHWLNGHSIRQPIPGHVMINTSENVGASRGRNIGAGSIPRYRRQEHVLFLDDDVYMCQNWDMRLMQLAAAVGPGSIISGYSHPFNHCEPAMNLDGELRTLYGIPLVVSSVAMMMPWIVFDDVGPWDEPGGPGGSEDFALCMRARDKFGYRFAVTDPQCVIHTGLMSSGGTAIAGYKELCEQNDKLLDFWNIRGRVTFQ